MDIEKDRLDSWKEIADYLMRDVRTVQRWESSEQLPVHRILHRKRSTVYAYKKELDIWMEEKEPLLGNNGESRIHYLKRRLSENYPALIIIIIISGAALATILYQNWDNQYPEDQSYSAIPLTSYEGREEHSALSPGGDQVVYSSNKDNSNQFDLYVEQIETRSLLRLTDTPERDYSPAWSNDGSRIAYLKASDFNKSDVMLIPSLAGDSRKVGEISTPEKYLGRQLSWSPGGRWLVSSDREDGYRSHLVLISPSTGERIRLTDPPNGYRGDHSASFSDDGRNIVFVRSLGEWMSDLFILNLSEDLKPEGKPKRLTYMKTFCTDPIWTANDKKIIFAAGTWPEMKFYELEMNKLRVSELIHYIGEGVSSASYSTTRNRLVFTRSRPEINIWKLDLAERKQGNNDPTPLIVSSGINWRPEYSRLGDQILYSSQRPGAEELWVYGNSTEETGPATKFWGTHCGTASWSPDDRLIVFHSCINGACDVYVKDAQVCMSKGPECEEKPCCLRRITSSEFDDFYPSWSRDGKWIYFASGRTGNVEVWKIPVEGGEPDQVTKSGGLYAIEGPDGTSLYYSKMGLPGIWKQNLADGSEELLIRDVFQHFAVVESSLYFINYTPHYNHYFTIRYLDLDTGNVFPVAEIKGHFAWSFAVAPDESAVVWSQFDRDPADIMIIDDFLMDMEPGSKTRREQRASVLGKIFNN